jgi:signal transduction histidine kinase/ligand-binding sensor domain-containing protein
MKVKVLLNVLTLIILLPLTSFSQNISFEYLTSEDGLSQSSVTCILQDKEGFMWFGTRSGLNKYDGYSIIKYFSDAKDSTSIAGDMIGALIEDHFGNLWIGTNKGISIYNREKDNFINLRHDDNDPNSLSGQSMSCFLEDSQFRFWVGSIEGGLNLFDKENNKFQHYQHDVNDINSLSNNNIRCLAEDNDGKIWIATVNGGLNLLDPNTKKITRFLNESRNPESLPDNIIFSITKDHSGTIWVGTLGAGLCKVNKSPDNKYSFSVFKPVTKDFRRLKILSLLADKTGGIWIGTENGGLDFFKISTKSFYNYNVDDNIPNSLNNNSVHSIYEDRTGNLWIGTYAGGVNVVKKNKKKIDTYRKIPGNLNSLSYNAVTCFNEDVDGLLWIGTDGGGVNCLDRKKDKMIHYNTKNTSFKSDAILAICKVTENEFWIGGWECGLNVFNRKNKTFTSFAAGKNGLPNNNISAVQVDQKGKVWVAIGNVGFACYNEITKTFKVYSTENSRLPNQWLMDLAVDKNGNILLAMAEGFSVFHLQEETFDNFSHNDHDPYSLSSNQVNTILVTRDSTIWLGTANGIDRFDAANKKFFNYYRHDGLAGNNVAGLVEDKNGHVWITTTDGISDYNPETGKYKNFNYSDGLQGNNFIINAAYCTSQGELLFGGTNGFNVIRPDSLFENPNKPPIVITDFKIFNKHVGIDTPGSPLDKQISETKQIVLTYKQQIFSFDFVAMDYTAPSQNKYAYYLEGLEKEWNYIGSKRTATYTNLDAGKYIFHVKGSNNDKIWNEEGSTIFIKILPPFWQTLWFKLLVILIISSILFVIYSSRIKAIKQRNSMLAIMVDERTKELRIKNSILETQTEELNEINTILEERQQQVEEQTEELMVQKEELERYNSELNQLNATKDKFFSIIAHDIKNPFTTIMGFSELYLHSFSKWGDDKKLKIMQIIHDSSRSLYQLLENLLQWSRSQRGMIEFNPVMTDLNQQINVAVTLLMETSNAKNIKIETNFLNKKITFHADLQMLDTIFRNILSNAIKFSYSGATIHITTSIEDHYAVAEVRDEGIGMSDEVREKLFRIDTHHTSTGTNNEKGTGLGLILAKEFILKHGGVIEVESVENKGSAFYIKIPL